MLTFQKDLNCEKVLNMNLEIQKRIGVNLELKSPFLVQDPS
jgi:hypothetical protein